MMPIRILMPALSSSMRAGTLSKWLVDVGDAISQGMVIAEIETDAATMEVEAVEAGVIIRILVAAGASNVAVGEPIAELLLPGEATGASLMQPDALDATEPRGAVRVVASPLARRLAREWGIDLARVAGSGPGGRIVRRDVEVAISQPAPPARARAQSTEPEPTRAAHPGSIASVPLRRQVATTRSAHALLSAEDQAILDRTILDRHEPGTYEIVPHGDLRRNIAERLARSTSTVPHAYLTLDCHVDEMLRARERMNSASAKRGSRACKLSINDFLIKAMAQALQHVPAANVTWLEGGMVRHKASDIGVAVAVDGGVYVPVVRHAELKSLSEISNEMNDLKSRARHGGLAAHEYHGGTTSISNLGMYGIKDFNAVINPPHATILAVGAATRQPIVAGDRLEIGTVMTCTLACDHRAIDGAIGAALLAAFKHLVEDPVHMLI